MPAFHQGTPAKGGGATTRKGEKIEGVARYPASSEVRESDFIVIKVESGVNVLQEAIW